MQYSTLIPGIPGFSQAINEAEKIQRLTQALLRAGVSADEIQRIKDDTGSKLSTADRLQKRLDG